MRRNQEFDIQGSKWKEHKAHTNKLYVLVDSYEISQNWFILVQKEKKSIWLNLHESSERKSNSFPSHVKNSGFNDDGIRLINFDLKENDKRNKYEYAVENCEFYALNADRVDELLKIDPTLEEYIQQLKEKQKEKDKNKTRNTQKIKNKYWIISGSPSQYEHDKMFKEQGFIDWKQNNYKYSIGDIVYVYISSPIQKIRYKTVVENINIPFTDIFNDEKYWIDKKEYQKGKDANKYVKLKLLSSSDDDNLSLDKFLKLGYLKCAVEGAKKITDDINFVNYLEKYFNEMPQQPKSQILYGPPGTGKTYNTKLLISEIIEDIEEKASDQVFAEKSTINEKTPWWLAIAIKLHDSKQTSCSVDEIIDLLEEYIKIKGGRKHSNKIWGNLQRHTSLESTTVNTSKRNKPYIFDKVEGKWLLTEFGKKYIAEYISNKDEGYIDDELSNPDKQSEFITFHQSYSYEEFVEGIKPVLNTQEIQYEMKNGIFKELCIRANANPDKKYVLIIDEINRGNISKIFGELITLIEDDKRIIPNGENDVDDEDLVINDLSYDKNSLVVNLPYSQKPFGVPNNLYIIGTMNTSDRSIASVDIALRRRFKFKEMMPQTDLVADFSCNFKEVFELLNKRISVLLDRDHQIGHSYFIKDKYENAGVKDLQEIWFDSILPLLNEYFYGDWEKLQKLLGCAKEKDDDTAFIKKLDIVKFADETTLDDEQNCFDFTDKEGIDFEAAMKHAFKDVFEKEEKNG